MMKAFDQIQDDYHAKMNALAKVLDEIFNPGLPKNPVRDIGFCLLVFEFDNGAGNDGRMNYISNAQREDMLCAMKEFIAAHEARLYETSGQKQ